MRKLIFREESTKKSCFFVPKTGRGQFWVVEWENTQIAKNPVWAVGLWIGGRRSVGAAVVASQWRGGPLDCIVRMHDGVYLVSRLKINDKSALLLHVVLVMRICYCT